MSVWDRRAIPNAFLDPITREIMSDPVTTIDGHTYEHRSIEKWFALGNRTSPVTNLKLGSLKITPNISMKKAIEDFLQESELQG